MIGTQVGEFPTFDGGGALIGGMLSSTKPNARQQHVSPRLRIAHRRVP